MSSVQENLVRKNAHYAASFDKGYLALPPAKKYTVGVSSVSMRQPLLLCTPTFAQAVVTCMDARIDPAAAFGIDLGDAHVIRNAGGSARDAIRSIVLSEQLLGTQEIVLVKHTGCGMLTFKNEDARGIVEKNLGAEAVRELGDLDFLPFPDLDAAVKDDIEYLRRSKLVPDDVMLSGWVYEVETGKTRRVV